MPTRDIVATLAVAATVAACTPPAPATLSEADAAAVRANIDAYTKTVLAGDWDAWGKTLAPDVVYMPPNTAPLIGRDAAVAYGRGLPKVTSLNITATEVAGLGDLAYARGEYSYVMTPTAASTVSDSGSFLDVYRRQQDGAWLAARVLWHSNAPVPASPPVPSKK